MMLKKSIFLFLNILYTSPPMNQMKYLLLTGIALLLAVVSSCTTMGSLERSYDDFTGLDEFFEEHDIPQYESTLPRLYFTGTDWNERSLELIAGATDYILISIFLGNYHETTHDVWELLKKKMDEGVRVYLIVDSSSYFQFIPETDIVVPAIFNYLNDLGIPVVEYNPFSLSNLFFLPALLDRDHRKYWVVDGTYLSMGGINVNYTSLGLPPETGNIDTMAEVISPGAVQQIVTSFVDTWNAYSVDKLSTDDFHVPGTLPHDEEVTSFWLVDHYWRGQAQVTPMFDAFVLYALDELWFLQGYAFLTPALTNRIAFAASRGVSVHIMFSEFARKPHYELGAWYGMLDLIDAGATVYMYTSPIGAFLHYKLIMADRKLTALGSVNYNLRSQTMSREVSYIFDDPRVGSMVMDNINDLMKHARVVSREEALEYRNFRNFLYFMLMQFWG